MKLTDLKEIAMTHKEYDTITSKVMSALRHAFSVDKLKALASSPYLPDRAKLDDAIYNSLNDVGAQLDTHSKANIIKRVKEIIG